MPPAPDANLSSSSSVRRTSFDDLPTELLKRIVEFASHSRSIGRDLERAAHAEERADSTTFKCRWPDGQTAAYAQWSYWHGRELEALSLVNKRLRALAMPYLVETITTVQLTKSYAAYDLADFPYLSQIRTLVTTPSGPHSYTEVTPLLRLLTGLESLHLNVALAQDLFEPIMGPTSLAETRNRRKYSRDAVERLAHRVTRLALSGIESVARPTSNVVFRLAASSQLRHLRLEGNLAAMWQSSRRVSQDWRTFFNGLAALESLEIHHTGADKHDNTDPETWLHPATRLWQDEWRMPNLRRFVLSTPAVPFVILPLLSAALPNVEELQLNVEHPDWDEVDEDDYLAGSNPVEWPRLETLAITCSCSILSALLPPFYSCASVRHLRLAPTEPEHIDDYKWIILAAIPQHTQRFIIHAQPNDPWTVEVRDWLEQECAAREVALEWHPVRWRWDEVRRQQDHYLEGWPSEGAWSTYPKDALLDDLDWAIRRLDSLQRTGDLDGYKEMCAILDPLRQCRFIERGAPIVVKGEDEDEVNVRTSRF